MSATADSEAADQAYFLRIEEAFIRLRGAPLLLSPEDWRVAQAWRRQGVPLELVLATVAEVFAQRAARGARGRINSLRYVAPAVDAAWEQARELRAGGGASGMAAGPGVQERLAKLADALPGGLPDRARWSDAIRALSGSAELVEARLAVLEDELHGELTAGMDPEIAASHEREVEDALKVAARLAPAERQRVRQRLTARALRRRFDLPVLSLFTYET